MLVVDRSRREADIMCAGIGVGALAAVMGFMFVAALLAVAFVAVRRSLDGPTAGVEGGARAVLDHRLAAGDISVEDYMERESLLRAPLALGKRSRRLL
jgi:uncharacterized membrane protein